MTNSISEDTQIKGLEILKNGRKRFFSNHHSSELYLSDYAIQVLTCPDPSKKVSLSLEAHDFWNSKKISKFSRDNKIKIPPTPARPELPKLLPMKELPSWKQGFIISLNIFNFYYF